MKRLFFITMAALMFLTSCEKDKKGIERANRAFTVEGVTGRGWPNTAGAVTFTWKVLAAGGPLEQWSVDFVGDHEPFSLSADYPNNTFTVTVAANEGSLPRSATLKVDYGDIWKFIDITQRSDIFFVSPGEEVSTDRFRYPVLANGTSTYVGDILNISDPDNLSVTHYRGNPGIFTPVLTLGTGGVATLKFTAKAWAGYFSFGYREAMFKIAIAGREQYDTYVIARQAGATAFPAGLTIDSLAPSGGFFRMKYNGLDVAGRDLEVSRFGDTLQGKTWDQVFDPNQTIGDITLWANVVDAPVNPCPAGWRAATRTDVFKIFGGDFSGGGGISTGLTTNYTGTGNSDTRQWALLDGTSVGNSVILGASGSAYFYMMTATAGSSTTAKSFSRAELRGNQAPTMVSAPRNAAAAGASTLPLVNHDAGVTTLFYGVRCVRDTPTE